MFKATRSEILIALFWGASACLTIAPAAAQCTSGTAVDQWRCWEQPITSSVDFYNGGAGNPYRDLVVTVMFTNLTQGGQTYGNAFWAADTANPKLFKVRAALPSGTWTWQINSCTGTTGGKSCASGVTWTPASGTITVNTSTSGPQIYARGFPIQNQIFVPPSGISESPISYADLTTPFFWAADTAWSALGKEASG